MGVLSDLVTFTTCLFTGRRDELVTIIYTVYCLKYKLNLKLQFQDLQSVGAKYPLIQEIRVDNQTYVIKTEIDEGIEVNHFEMIYDKEDFSEEQFELKEEPDDYFESVEENIKQEMGYEDDDEIPDDID